MAFKVNGIDAKNPFSFISKQTNKNIVKKEPHWQRNKANKYSTHE